MPRVARKSLGLHAVLIAAMTVLIAACGGGGGYSGGGGSGSSGNSSSSQLAITIHYKRIAGDYTGWGLHLWNDTGATAAIASNVATTWAAPHPFDGVTGGWDVARIPLINVNANLNFIVHKDDAKSPMPDLHVNPSTFGSDVWVVQDTATLFASQADADAAAARVGHQADALDMSAVPVGTTTSALPAHWNERAQFMEIFIRSYKDSDGDGKGDIKGLISKLDYLKSLGVTGLWLMPIYKSEDHDHGYAVEDYRAIEPDYGAMADFDELVTQAHARGIGIVLDYVMNHSADQNPLFLDAMSSASNSRRDWYEWNASDPGWTGLAGPSWHVSESGWYYGVFSANMPDWNLTNPAVVAYHMDNLRFWLNHGVDGFRFDAAETFVENGSGAWYDQPQNHPILLQAQNVIMGYANRFMVCEAPDHPDEYAVSSSCGHAFAFGRQTDTRNTAKTGTLASGLAAWLGSSMRSHEPLFLSNHDSFAGTRPWDDLSGHGEGDYRVAAAIELLTSDTPFVLYGEEVGESDNGESGDAAIRAPMNWSGDTANAGFTTGTPYRGLSLNVITHNVTAEDGVPGSLLGWYSALYAVRTQYPVLQSGSLTLLSNTGDPHLVFLRAAGGQTAVVLINLSAVSQTLTADTGVASTAFAQVFPSGGGTVSSTASGRVSVTVPAQGVVILLAP